jgi:hypothetical protein
VEEEESIKASDVKKRSAGFGWRSIRLVLPCLMASSLKGLHFIARSVDLDVDLLRSGGFHRPRQWILLLA